MQVLETRAAMREAARGLRANDAVLGLVPTMGALHDGHLALVRRARAECDRVAVSIFVNPAQFAPNEDLATYPRTLARDLDLLRAEGADAVFTPSAEEMYVPGAETIVETTRLARILMGRLRPGHFRGVATVVTKLFNIVQPDRAYFGEKDYQQLQVIRRMVRDLDMPVEIVGLPTVREGDGLAMSSRNVKLTPEDRAAAAVVSRALDAAEAACLQGATAARMRAEMLSALAREPRAALQSADIRDAQTLGPVRGRPAALVVALLAVKFGEVLLIDQRVAAPPQLKRSDR
ncbi:MAG: pantoate--beta-alanine ligase [Pseudomonadota bacterium]